MSRQHAQIRAISGAYHFFDLGSSGGSKINGRRVQRAALLAGDVISLAGISLIYGEEQADIGDETIQMKKQLENGPSTAGAQ